ncbi:hypothetical protein [Nocardioides sp.]|uniref:hypothetical protein n=1 Tax=Nocardioides sp. TaxID=35761 RepID=UPI0039E58BA4
MTLTAGLLGLTPAARAGAPTAEQFAAMGSFSAPDIALVQGCATYSYGYSLAPSSPDWTVEVTVVGPGGLGIASEIIISGADPTVGSKPLTLCSTSTPAGVYTIRGRITVSDYPDQYSGWLTPTTFVVNAPATAPTTQPAGASARCVKARQKAKRLHTKKARQKAKRICRRARR